MGDKYTCHCSFPTITINSNGISQYNGCTIIDPSPRPPNICPCCHHALTHLPEGLVLGRSSSSSSSSSLRPKSFHFAHHKPSFGLRQSVLKFGCRLCWMFLDARQYQKTAALNNAGSLDTSDNISDYVIEIYWSRFQASRGTRLTLSRGNQDFESGLRLQCSKDLGFPSDLRKANFETSSDYSASLLLAEQWLTKCQNEHDCLSKTLPRKRNPTRLIFIETQEHPRLVSGSAIALDAPYVVLSHCWGNIPTTKLTPRTVKEFYSRIDSQNLCKSFQEAFVVARKLGFEYIWIDTLCIIQEQDSQEDWLRESVLMSEVYGNSSICIAATGAHNGDEGLFFARPPLHLRSFRYLFQVNGEGTTAQFDEWDIYPRCITTQPLSTRGWAVQERVLAPRVLHFSQTELLWECESKCMCELYPDGIPGKPLSFDKSQTPTWNCLLEIYSSANLTFPRDKLIAIAGIAQWYQKLTGDRYLAGMWRDGMEISLCWFCANPGSRPAEYRAPSWSWASVDGQISHQRRSSIQQSYIEIPNVSVLTRDGDPYSQVVSGILILDCAALFPIFINEREYDYEQIDIGLCIKPGKFFTRIRTHWDTTPSSSTNTEDRTTTHRTLYLLPIYSKDNWTYGFILLAIKDKPWRYQRAGVLSLEDKWSDGTSLDEMIAAWNVKAVRDDFRRERYRNVVELDEGNLRFVVEVL